MPYVRIDGVELYHEVAGAGDPVVLLHGGFGSIEAWRDLIGVLVAHFRVFAFERPGHGRSADLPGEYHYARGVEETLAFLDTQGLASAHVVGFSDGGNIALLLAVAHPDRVRSLVTLSANLDPSAFTRSAGLGTPVLDPLPSDASAGVGPERAVHADLSPDGPGHADVVLTKLVRLWESEPSLVPADLAAVTARTLVVSGDRDTIRPDHSLLIAASIRGARLFIVPGTTHDLLVERPDLVNGVVAGFLREGSIAAGSG